MRFITRLSFFLFASLAFFNSQAAEELQVKNAWIPEMPPVSRVLAGFAKFENPTSKPIEIVAFSSPSFSRIEMHQSMESNGMASMIPQKSLTVQANSELTLKHGSYHLMLFNPVKRLKAGDTITINAKLADGNTISFQAEVKNALGGKMQKNQNMKCGAGKCGSRN